MDAEEELQKCLLDFQRLTQKEREVLDQLLLHKTLKVIANHLGITVSAVDQRLKTARIKLGAADRYDAARRYADLKITCVESTTRFSELGQNPERQVALEPGSVKPVGLLLHQDAPREPELHVMGASEGPHFPEGLDRRFGRRWRIAAIPVFALVILMLIIGLLTMAKVASEFL